MSNENLAALLIFVGALLKFLEKIYDNWQLKKAAVKVSEELVKETESVKQLVAISDDKKSAHLSAQDVKLEKIAQDVTVVKTQTNGIVEKAEQAAFERGKAEGEKK